MSWSESRPRGVLSVLVAVLLALGLAVPARAEVTVAERGGPLRLQAGDRVLDVSLSPDAVRGPGIALRRTGDALVGRWRGEVVNIGWDEGPLLGHIGTETVRLRIFERAPEPGLRLEGNFGSWPSSLVISPVGVTGSVGGCDYSLTVAGSHYDGWRTCRTDVVGEPTEVSLFLPEDVLELTRAEEVTLLSLLLSVMALPPEGEPSGTGRTLTGPGLDARPDAR